jgi:hypothetical protein
MEFALTNCFATNEKALFSVPTTAKLLTLNVNVTRLTAGPVTDVDVTPLARPLVDTDNVPVPAVTTAPVKSDDVFVLT